jgi:hypothetical protein
LCLVTYFSLSIIAYKDFGPTSDEWTERRAAENLVRYLSQPATFETITDSDYRDPIDYPLGHHPLVTKYQRSYQLMQFFLNPNGYYEWDHLINLGFGSLYFLLGYSVFYIAYKSVWKSLVSVLFLAITPRIVGDIPANSKDMPFAIMYLASLAAIYIFSIKQHNTYVKIFLLGTIFGLMQTFRTVGFSIYIVYLIYYFYFFWISRVNFDKKMIFNFFAELLIIGIFSLFISISIFPWLGANFYANFFALLLDAKSYQNWDDTIFFDGEFLMKAERPWYYLYTWIFITTPVFILGMLGVFPIFIKKLFKDKLFSILFIALIVNLSLYTFLQPVIYNALRHFLYLLPILVLIAAIIFVNLLDSIKTPLYRLILILLLAFNTGTVVYNFITLHPYQYIYFNELVGGLPGANGRYELDYWGATYKEATEWLVENHELTHENFIRPCNNTFSIDYYSQREFFLTYGDHSKATHTICDVDNERKLNLKGNILFEVKRQGVVLNRVWENASTETK